MKTVGDLVHTKGSMIWSVGPKQTVYEALQLMAEREIGGVLVLESGKPVGIFTERDYARQVILKGKASKDTLVEEIMTRKVVYIRPDKTLEDCMALMTDKRVRHLPVMDDSQLIGLVSIGDVVKAVISEKQFLIEQLENYIQQSG